MHVGTNSGEAPGGQRDTAFEGEQHLPLGDRGLDPRHAEPPHPGVGAAGTTTQLDGRLARGELHRAQFGVIVTPTDSGTTFTPGTGSPDTRSSALSPSMRRCCPSFDTSGSPLAFSAPS